MEQLLTLFNRFSKLVKEAFQDDPRFLTARDKVCVSAGILFTIRLVAICVMMSPKPLCAFTVKFRSCYYSIKCAD